VLLVGRHEGVRRALFACEQQRESDRSYPVAWKQWGGNACSAGSAHAVHVVLVVVRTVEVDDETQVGYIEAARCNGCAHEHVDDAGFEIPRAGSRCNKRRTRKRRT
jgi:hypothetical protein